MRIHSEQTGLIGKVIVVWLLIVALLGVVAVDAASIVFTRFKLSDIASNAAAAGVNTYRATKSSRQACDAAEAAVKLEDETIDFDDSSCKVDTRNVSVTITLRKRAGTLLVGRFSFSERFAKIVQKETVGSNTL